MIAARPLLEEVASASALLSLFLVLLVLFTAEQAKRLDAQLSAREFDDRIRTEIEIIASFLGLFTAAALVGLFSLARRSVTALTTTFDAVAWIFILAWMLLGGVLVWQAAIVAKCGSTAARRRLRTRGVVLPAVVAVAAFDAYVLVCGLLS